MTSTLSTPKIAARTAALYLGTAAAGLSLLGSSAFAQSNTIVGLNVKLGDLSSLTAQSRTGTFPNGTSGIAMSTTSCNNGTVNVPWLQAMQENHPFIGFLICRERNGRFEQISDRSFVKHGFFALSNSQCTPCQQPSNGTFLGVGCSDTYGTSNNGDGFWLGPPEEINSWLGTWTAACSHFDKGEPPVAPAQQCDGVRSLTSTMVNNLGPLGHKVRVNDADFNVSGATFYYQAQYVVRAEAEANRGDNLGSRQFTATWNVPQTNKWNFSTIGAMVPGSILQRWSGAAVTSGTNGADDGRVYIGVKVTGPTAGVYHYEYAIHNRDNHRGVGSISIPALPCTTVSNLFFRDLDTNAANDWAMSQTDAAIVFTAPVGNALRWNTVYNIAFDSNSAPSAVLATLAAADAGTGAASFNVTTTGPASLPSSLSYGVGTPGCFGPHNVCADPAPSVGNVFNLESNRGPANSLALGLIGNAQDLAGFDYFGVGIQIHTNVFLSTELYTLDVPTDAAGNSSVPITVPNNPVFSGLHYYASLVYGWLGPCAPSTFGLSSSRGLDLLIQ
ncbi:MAG: hypothetical protein JNJ88_13870 [Planctomycetes bacterium]|nr:hypothetical protein [Planctomycetota bacterium]